MKKLLLILIIIFTPSNICGETCLTIGNSALIIEESQFIAIQPSRIFDEKLEGAGYEEAGWTEQVGAGCTVDEDADSSDVGNLSGWGSQCLKIIGTAGNNAYVYWNFGQEVITHFRVNIVPTAEGLANGEWLAVFSGESNAYNICFKVLLEQVAGSVYFNCYCSYDGSGHDFYSLLPVSLNTQYRIEVKWDATNNVWAWKIDDIAQPNNIDDSDPITSEGTLSGAHETDCKYINVGNYTNNAYSFTAYYDLIAIDDVDWVGAEG